MAKLKRLTPEELVLKTVVAPTGERGPKGDKGEKGDTGDMGPIGARGADGISGLSGIQGISGLQGSRGETGVPGVSGQSGSTGPEGPQGPVAEFEVEGTRLKVKNKDGEFEELADLKLSEPPIRGLSGGGGGSIIRPDDTNKLTKILTVFEDYQASFKDHVILADASAGNIDVFLPPAIRANRRQIHIKRINSTGNFVNVVPAPGEAIDDDTGGVRIILQYDCITVASDSVDWWII